MQQKNLAVILARDLAEKLATAAFVVDNEGRLVYFNETAGMLLGQDYSSVGSMPMSEWSTGFDATDTDGSVLDPDNIPLVQAIKERGPRHRRLRITGRDDVQREIEVTAIPLFARADELVGAVAFFWEGE